MVKVNIVFLNFLQLTCRNQSVYKQCVEFVCSIEIIGLALVGSIGDVSCVSSLMALRMVSELHVRRVG